jgi:6-pyruvoyltetrahydropterin/6-carboxytetrahydropterin synthase
MSFSVTRRIGIDAGHRIMTHGSKCRNIHGHRYEIEATAEAADLHHSGEQTDMVLDFAFLKEEMLAEIDAPCDHGFICGAEDIELLGMFAPTCEDSRAWIAEVQAQAKKRGHYLAEKANGTAKLYIVPFQPTAECLAKHWFERLAPRLIARSGGLAHLVRLSVWETPNSRADYTG